VPVPTSILAERVTFRLRSLDRLYLNLYLPRLQTPGQVATFLHDVRGYPLPSPALFGQMTRDFAQRVERYAAAHDVPLVRFPRGVRKEEIADDYFGRAPERQGVIFVGVAQERSSSWWGQLARSGTSFSFQRRTVAVNHYYFYLRDPDWGRVFLKFSSYAPFGGRLYLNGHSWLSQQLTRRCSGFRALDNGLLAAADPELAQRLAQRLGAGEILRFPAPLACGTAAAPERGGCGRRLPLPGLPLPSGGLRHACLPAAA
jgi:hypothetical protein